MLALWIWASTTLALLGAIINFVNSCWVSTVIDRVLANSCWLSTVIDVAVFHLPHIASDHALLLIKVTFEYVRKRGKKKAFYFEPHWFECPSLTFIVQDNWPLQGRMVTRLISLSTSGSSLSFLLNRPSENYIDRL